MARRATSKRTESADFGNDSFLDIVANIVGILIILVMVTGVRVKLAPATSSVPPAPAKEYRLAEQRRRVENLQSELRAADARLAAAERDARHRQADLARVKGDLETETRELNEETAKSDDAIRHRRQLEALLAAGEHELGGLIRDRAAIPSPKKNRVEVLSFPAPISKSVDGPEIHFQLKDGLVAHVPMRTLVESIVSDFRVKVASRPQAGLIEGKVGPIEQFDLTYAMRRLGSRWVLEKGVFVPQAVRLGETLDQALAADSHFRHVLYSTEHEKPIGSRRVREPSSSGLEQVTVTLWTYPDSFGLYRRLKKELYLQGFAVAGRPLPFGTPIAGSRTGTKSQAQ